ncbi:hypothetical protein ANCDUO_12288, partial [Ancylostoma duodenale]
MAETGQVPAAFIPRLPHDHDMIEMETAGLFSLVEVQGNSQGEGYRAVKGLMDDVSRLDAVDVEVRHQRLLSMASSVDDEHADDTVIRFLDMSSANFRCLLMRGPSAMAYQLGFSLAIVVVFCSVAGILHYVPSPSLFAYPQLRFQSSTLRLVLSILQTAVTFICILLVLLHSSSLLASVSLFSLYLCVALVAFFPLFAVVFSGYSCIMTLSLILNIFCILFGAGVFLVFGIKDVTSFRTIIPYEFTISDSILSLCVGFVVSLYQLTSSPLQYQAYFPIPTLHKLRLTLAFHGVFQLFSSILQTVPHPALAYAVIVSFLSVFTFCVQWLYMCITTHVWEEFVKTHLRDLGSMKQLCCLQSILLLICAISVTIVSAIRFLQLPYDFLTPTIMLTLLTICASMCGIFMCGYFLPFCNSKGAMTSLIVTAISSLALFYLYASHNNLPSLKNTCTVEAVTNATVVI